MDAAMSDNTTQGRHFTTIFTVNIELVQLSPDVLILCTVLKQLVLDGSHQARTREVGMDDEIRGIHLERLAVGFVVDVLVSATKCGGIACREEEVQILGGCRGEIDESKKTIWLMGALHATGSIHTLGPSFRSKDAVLLETAIWHRCRREDDRKRELF